MTGHLPGRTPLAGVLLFLVALLPMVPAPAQQLEHEERDSVTAVIDGDTIVLERLGHVRLIGVNCPEVASSRSPGEPLADEARVLVERLALGQRVRLAMESEQRDSYGRVLAHVVLADGRNLQELLLARGLASAIAIPPNLYYLERYRDAERQARAAASGIWGTRYYQPVRADRLGARHRGYRFVTGRVSSVSVGKRYVYLNFTDRFAVVVPQRDWLRYFDREPQDYEGLEVVVRGWVTRYRHGLRIHIRHPAMLAVAGEDDDTAHRDVSRATTAAW